MARQTRCPFLRPTFVSFPHRPTSCLVRAVCRHPVTGLPDYGKQLKNLTAFCCQKLQFYGIRALQQNVAAKSLHSPITYSRRHKFLLKVQRRDAKVIQAAKRYIDEASIKEKIDALLTDL